MQHDEIVREFFSAYQMHDYGRMSNLLSPNVHFSDFAFDIEGRDVFAMWQLFCLPGEGRGPVDVRWFRNIHTKGDTVTAEYRVAYTYGENRRPVDYTISARFALANGKIAEHHDSASIQIWAWQALGPLPALISWTPFLRAKVKEEARKKLDAFIRSRSVASSNMI